MIAARALAVCRDLFTIILVWSLLPLTLLILQVLGLDFGFNLWPIGEFRNWLSFLQSDGVNAAKVFWSWDYRNVLSPWWFIAARPLIDNFSAAPLILHLLASLFVGLCAYLLFEEVTASRHFGLSVGILCAIFIADTRRDGVVWNHIAALGCTLLSVYLFARFCKGGRKNMSALATSYLVWFVALGTYTLQVGGAGAVFFVSYQNGRSLLRAALDVLPYVALLVIYVMIWITTTPAGGDSDIYRLSFSFDALLKSIAAGLWNKSYGIFWIWVWNSGPWLMTATFTILAVLILVTIRYDLPVDSHRPPQFPTLAFALLIGICVVAPTIAVESMSSTWFPGTRWTSLLQFWSPLLYCVVVLALLSIFLPAHWQLLWQSLTACAAAFIVVLDLGVNNTQIVHTRQERAFFSELQRVVSQDRASGLKFPRRYAIQLVDPAPYLALAQAVAPGYARTLLGRDATFTIFKVRPEPGVEDTVLFWKDEHLNRSLSD